MSSVIRIIPFEFNCFQVMYMYYLLGFRHIMTCKNEMVEEMMQMRERRGQFGLTIQQINHLLGENATARVGINPPLID